MERDKDEIKNSMSTSGEDRPVIRASTPRSEKYDTKIDIYTKDPSGPHESIHITINSDEKSAHIIDTMDGPTQHTDVQCYLTTACMRHYQENFDDDCYELRVLRWFRDNYVTKEDIEHYYKTAPVIVEAISRIPESGIVYDYIYDNVVDACVEAIERGDYLFAYNRYKNSILSFEEHFARPYLEQRLKDVLNSQI